MEQGSICIIGAGISGLLACKYAVSKGFLPVVYESRSSIGGVWTKTLKSTKLQSSKSFYQFSDFPWPSSVVEKFPGSHSVLDYLHSYAAHFDLLRHMRFNTRVLSLDFQEPPFDQEMQSWIPWGRGTWNVTVRHSEATASEIHRFKFVILCVGRFSDEPNIPGFPAGKGPEAFQGKVTHSMNYSDMGGADFTKGKRVVVVGFQKSALDISMECSAANGGADLPCTVVYRTKHWNVPDYFPWGIPLGYLYFNRFAELLLHKPNEGFLLSLLATFLSPVRWSISKFVETYIRRKLKLDKFGMVPEHSFLQEISSCLVSTVPEGFYDRVQKGIIILKHAPTFGFCENGIVVGNDKNVIEADVVILSTGFSGVQKLKNMFASTLFQNYIAGSDDVSLPLYRGCIHVKIPQLAVIGLSESLSNLYTSEMRSRWVVELLQGSFQVPSIKEMEEDVGLWEGFVKTYSGKYYRRWCIASLHIWYNDQLCKDMGWNPRRKKGFLTDLFQPYGPLDYAHC